MDRYDDVAVHGAGSLGASRVERLVRRVVRGERRRARIEVSFVDPRSMRRLNAQHLGHATVTDVITFALPEPDGSVTGDIYICRYAAARNARHHAAGVREELLRLVIHGTLHALGYTHPDGATRERSAMWRRQERYLAAQH